MALWRGMVAQPTTPTTPAMSVAQKASNAARIHVQCVESIGGRQRDFTDAPDAATDHVVRMLIAPNADLHVWTMRRGFCDALGSAATTGGPAIEAPLPDGDSAADR
jgi:hypothetical protein